MSNKPMKMFDEFRMKIAEMTNKIEKLNQKEFTNKDSTVDSMKKKLKLEMEFLDKFQSMSSQVFPEQKEMETSSSGVIKLNIGGKKLDLKIPNLNSFEVDPNSVISFLQTRWSKYLLKDKDERIYFDYERKWFERILRKDISDDSELISLLPTFQETQLLQKVFQGTRLVQSSLTAQLVNIFQHQFSFVADNSVLQSIVGELWQLFPMDIGTMTLKNIYSSNNLNYTITQGVQFTQPNDWLIIFKTVQGVVYCCFTDAKLSADKPLNTPRTVLFCCNDGEIWRQVSTKSEDCHTAKKEKDSVFPLSLFANPQLSTSRDFQYCADPYLRISKEEPLSFTIFPRSGNLTRPDSEECSTYTCYKITQFQIYNCNVSPPLKRKWAFHEVLRPLNKTFTSNEELMEHLQPMLLAVNEVIDVYQSIVQLNAELAEAKQSFTVKVQFIYEFLSSVWSAVGLQTTNDCSNTERDSGIIIENLQNLLLSIGKYKEEEFMTGKSNSSPILYLNVERERICVLKSTLQEMIPNSQLTLRLVSERWTEQSENLDDDGNIKINDIPGLVFKKIIEGIRRGKLMNKKEVIIKISDEDQKNIFIKYLDFLIIENYRFTF
jgi:hypothetical protein